MSSQEFYNTQEGAEALGKERAIVFGWCETFPGFAIKVNGKWQISAEHLERVKNREDPKDVAASPSGAPLVMVQTTEEPAPPVAPEPAAEVAAEESQPAREIDPLVRERLLKSYLFVAGLAHHGDLAKEKRDAVLLAVCANVLSALEALGLTKPEDDLREAIGQTDACAVYEQISGRAIEV